MPDREKIIKGMETCISQYECSLDNCPYYINESGLCWDRLMTDALALLKEQEAKSIIRKQCKREYPDGTVEYFAEWHCPHCNYPVTCGFDAPWIKYCCKCGKPILWEDR